MCFPNFHRPTTDQGFPGGSDGEEPACNAGQLGSIPGSGRSPGEGNGYPLQYSCLDNSMDRGAQQATVREVTESDPTEGLTLSHFHFQQLIIARRATTCDLNLEFPWLSVCVGVHMCMCVHALCVNISGQSREVEDKTSIIFVTMSLAMPQNTLQGILIHISIRNNAIFDVTM